jgi:hypothetical protein
MWHLVTKWYNKAQKIRDSETDIHLTAHEAIIKWSVLEECADELMKELIKESKKCRK